MNIKTKVSITRRSNQDGNHWFSIKVEDESSSLPIIETEISANDFALAISGFSCQESKSRVFNNREFLGKKREIQRIVFELSKSSLDKQVVRDAVKENFENSGLASDGWYVHSDGTSEQQNQKGHRYTLIRFV